MFGHQNNDEQANAAAPVAADAPAAHQPETIAPTAATSAPTVGDTGGYTATNLPHAVAPAAAAATPPVTPPAPTAAVEPATAPRPAAAAAAPQADEEDLISLKQTALHELSPLIGHLDQTPEDKFRTTMMMIQASDDQSLLPTALAAAKQIKDEKTRAQALLDVVNEINYFTQQHEA